MIDNQTVGKTIAALRQQANLSQQGLANLCSVTHQAVSKWENGQALPDMQTMLFLSKYFEVSMEDILMGNLPGPADIENVSMADAETCENIQTEAEDKDALSAVDGEEHGEAMSAAGKQEEEKNPSMDWKQIAHLAPFASRGTIEQLVREKVEKGDVASWEQVFHLLPFCSRSMADYLLDKLDTGALDWKYATRIMVHASRERVEKIFEKFLDEMDVEKLRQIAPFVSGKFMADCLRKMEDVDSDKALRHLLPFLPREMVDELIQKKMGRRPEQKEKQMDWGELLSMASHLDGETVRRRMEKILAKEGVQNLDWGLIMAFAPYGDEEMLSRLADRMHRAGQMKDLDWGLILGLSAYLNEEIISRLTKWMIREKGVADLDYSMMNGLLSHINEDAREALNRAMLPEEEEISKAERAAMQNEKFEIADEPPFRPEEWAEPSEEEILLDMPIDPAKMPPKERILMRIARKAVEEGNEEWLEEHGEELTQDELEIILPRAAEKQMWGALEELWEHANDETLQFLIQSAVEHKNWELLEELLDRRTRRRCMPSWTWP